MRFAKWRELKGYTRAKVAELFGSMGVEITEVSVFRHETGLRFPPPPTQENYEALTEGAVTPRDWVETWNDPEAAAARAKETASADARKTKAATA